MAIRLTCCLACDGKGTVAEYVGCDCVNDKPYIDRRCQRCDGKGMIPWRKGEPYLEPFHARAEALVRRQIGYPDAKAVKKLQKELKEEWKAKVQGKALAEDVMEMVGNLEMETGCKYKFRFEIQRSR